MGFRDRGGTRRQFGAGGDVLRYQMRQRVLALGDDFWVENDAGERVFRVDGKLLRLRNTLDLEDPDGHRIYRIQTRAIRLHDTMAIEAADGRRVASVRKALITPLRERWDVEVEEGDDLSVRGNVLDHEYEIDRDGDKVAEVSKRWFRVRDTYGIEILPGSAPELILAVTVALDAMTHPAR
jgi:uncharacterized protein YxjI